MILELQHRRPDGDVDTYHLKPGRRYHVGRGSGCEVRILDLKLSRRHAALECIDQRWQLIDLSSTNGCRLNGEEVVGTNPLAVGCEIEIGLTSLVITGIGAAQPTLEVQPVSDAFSPQDSTSGAQPPLADHKCLSAAFLPGEFNPESSANFHSNSLVKATPVAVPVLPATPTDEPIRPVVVAAPGDEPNYFITVLGKRIGPLTRAVAHDLKARELKGTLRPGDIESYPAT
jgi:hypothetical protein